MSGSAMKLKAFSYSASPTSNCADRVLLKCINKHKCKPEEPSVSRIPLNFSFGNGGPEKRNGNEPQESKTEQIINASNHKESYIDDKHLPCLKEEIMKLEAEKRGSVRIAAAYYNRKEFNAYSAYALKSAEYHKLILGNMNKYAKIGMYIGAICGAVMSESTLASFAIYVGKFMSFGLMVGAIASFPPLYRDFSEVKRICLNPEQKPEM